MADVIHARGLWEKQMRDDLRRRVIGCENEWQPAPRNGCRCVICAFVRDLPLAARPFNQKET